MATIKDIANQLKLSQTTVSLVLRGKGDDSKIAKKTQEKIWEAASAMGYQVNMSARKLKAMDSTIYIAVYWTIDYRGVYMLDFFNGLWEEARKYDKTIEFIIKPYDDLTKSFEAGGMYHAAIICNVKDDELHYLESLSCLIPIIIYNRQSERFDSVLVNDHRVGTMAAQILDGYTISKALFITAPMMYPGMKVLRDSFVSEMSARGILVSVLEVDDSSAGGQKAALLYMERGMDADAVFCGSASITQPFLNRLVRNGVAIPDQCRILAVSGGDPEQDANAVIPLSVIDIQRHILAAKCLSLAMERIESRTKAVACETAEPVYIPRESC